MTTLTKADKQAFFFIMMGILLTMMGVGGVENSMTNYELFCGLSVSILGLAFMWIATLIVKREGL